MVLDSRARKLSVRLALSLLFLSIGAGAGLALRASSAQVPVGRLVSTLFHDKAPETSDGRSDTAERPSCNVPMLSVSNEVVTDSRHPGYDPGALAYMGVDMREIFENEHRNERWARTLESSLGLRMLSDASTMVPQMRDGRMECRSRICKVTWAATSDEDAKRIRVALGLGAPSPEERPITDRDGRQGLMFVFRPTEYLKTEYGDSFWHFDATDPEAYSRIFEQRRVMILTDYREGRRSLPTFMAGLPVPGVE